MNLRERQQLFARNVALLIELIFRARHSCTLGEAYRADARDTASPVHLLHDQRLALDLIIFSPEGHLLKDTADCRIFGDYWQKMHPDNRWGGLCSYPDPHHFEMLPPSSDGS